MNANNILTDGMTLDEKLAAIDAAMKAAQAVSDEHRANGQVIAPLDPSLLTICDGCE